MLKRVQEQGHTELRLRDFIISVRSYHAVVQIKREYLSKIR